MAVTTMRGLAVLCVAILVVPATCIPAEALPQYAAVVSVAFTRMWLRLDYHARQFNKGLEGKAVQAHIASLTAQAAAEFAPVAVAVAVDKAIELIGADVPDSVPAGLLDTARLIWATTWGVSFAPHQALQMQTSALRATGDPQLQGALFEAYNAGGEYLTVGTYQAWAKRELPGGTCKSESNDFSMVLPLGFYPVTLHAFAIAMFDWANMWMMVPTVNRRWYFPPPLWWLFYKYSRTTCHRLLRRCLSCYVDPESQERPLRLHCPDYWMYRLVRLCCCVPGRWLPDLPGPDAFLSWLVPGLTTADIVDSTGKTLQQAIESAFARAAYASQHPYNGDDSLDSWRCGSSGGDSSADKGPGCGCMMYRDSFEGRYCKHCNEYYQKHS